MNLKKQLIKLLENKNFYYVVLALTLIHLIMYLYRGAYKAVSFLILCAIIVYNFTKSRTIILLISLIATHFFVAGRSVYEGLENKDGENKDGENKDSEKNKENIEKLKNTDPELANAASKVAEDADKNKPVVAGKIASEMKDPNNPGLNKSTTTSEDPVPESFEGGKKGTVRLDYAATIGDAYGDLENMLGNDGINKLTEDTKKLMSQQKNLFNAMNELAPAVKETMSMLEGLDLNGISGMSSSASEVAGKLKNLMSTNKVKPANDKTK